jgi:AmpD protein
MGRIVPIRARTTKRRPRLGLKAGEAWLQGARQVRSPNCDDRPAGVPPSLVVIHGISLPPGQFGGPHIDELFTNTLDPLGHPYFRDLAGIRVSSHLLIRRNGEVVQYVPLHRRAWHAGKSSFRGRDRCNDYSVGIELEGADSTPYTQAQYRRLATVIRLLRRRLPTLATAPIVGHSEIAPGRKTDPGVAFDWPHLRQRLAPRTARRR